MHFQNSLGNLLLFNRLDKPTATRIVSEMFEMPVDAGEILIQQGDSGASATKLFVVKSGKFEASTPHQLLRRFLLGLGWAAPSLSRLPENVAITDMPARHRTRPGLM